MLCGAETMDTGAMWECPLLLELQRLPEEARPCGLGPRGHTNLRARAESYRCVRSKGWGFGWDGYHGNAC